MINRIILTLLAIGFMATACATPSGDLHMDFNFTLPTLSENNAMKPGSDYNKPIPMPEKKKWNGND